MELVMEKENNYFLNLLNFKYKDEKQLKLIDINDKVLFNELKNNYITLQLTDDKLLKCKIFNIDDNYITWGSIDNSNLWKMTSLKKFINYDKIKFYYEKQVLCSGRYFVEEINNSILNYDILVRNKKIKSKMTKRIKVLFDNYLVLHILSFL